MNIAFSQSDVPISTHAPEGQPAVHSATTPDQAKFAAVRRLSLLDAPAEQAFDRLTRLAAKVLHAPVALLSLVDGDRSFFKSSVGVPEPWASQREMPLSHSICKHVVALNAPLVINDARANPLVSDTQAVAELRIVAYLGIPLIASEGHAFGTFAVIDTVPREWTSDDVTTLGDLAASAMTEIELRAEANQRLLVEQRLNLMESVVGNAAAVFIAEADPAEPFDPRIVFVNDAYTRLTGYSPDEVLGRTHNILNNSATDRTQIDTIRTSLATWQPTHLECLTHRKDGSAFWAELKVVPIADKAGRYSHWVIIQRDNSAKKATEVALRRGEERYRSLVLATSQVVWITDSAGQLILDESSTWQAFTGQTDEEAQGVGWLGAVHPDDRTRISEEWDRAVAQSTFCQVEYRVRTADGEYRHTASRGIPVMGDDGRVREWVCTNTDITEQKLAEEALRQSDGEMRRLALIAQRTDNGVILTDSEGRIEWVNDGFTRICEYRLDEVVGKTPGSVLQGPDTDPATVAHMRERLLQGQGFHVEIVNYAKSGRPYWAAIEVQPILDDQGNLTRFMSIESEITARKRIDELLKQANLELEVRVDRRTAELTKANEFLKAVLENVQDGIAACDSQGVITHFNKTTREFGGALSATESQLAERPIHPDQWASHYSAYHADGRTMMTTDELPLMRALRDERVQNLEMVIGAEGDTARFVLASGRAFYDGQGTKLGAVVSMNDVTERKRANDGIRETEERFRLLVDGVQDYAIIMLDVAGHIISWNSGAERIKGYKAEEIVGRHFSCFYSREDVECRKPDLELEVAVDRGRFEEEGRRVRKDGTYFFASVVITAVRDHNGQLRGFSKVTRDITERKRIEMELLKVHEELEQRVETRTAELALAKDAAEAANRAKSEFFSRMSHELRTPLNAILGFGQLLELDALSDTQRESAEQIGKGGRHLLALINEVLDIARIEAGAVGIVSLEDVDLGEVVKEVLRMIQPLADQAGVRVRPPRAGTCSWVVRADLQRLKQVLLNLLSNGIKYNRPGGTVAVFCEEVEATWLRINVTDTGHGIAPEKMHRLFAAFDRLEAEQKGVEGTGLGLTLSKGLVEAMQGKMGVESTFGKGSTFWVELPRIHKTVEPACEQPATVADHEETSPTNGTVLYVEDNPANFRLVERILKLRPGVCLISASQGQLGIDLARQHRPDLIFLDLHLPGLPGDEVLRRLREGAATRDIPVILLSADGTPRQVERLLAAGANRYLVKPLDVKEFLQIVDEILSVGDR